MSGATLRVARASGSGNGNGAVLAIKRASMTAWVANAQTVNPGGIGMTANDTTVYSCKLYTGWSGEGSASFGPVVGGGATVPVSAAQQGPTLWATVAGARGSWGVGTNLTAGPTYTATNSAPAANAWYQVTMSVNPATNEMTIHVRNLTNSGGWVLLQFAGGVTTLPAGLVPGTESPSSYNAFEISGSPGAQFDALGARLYEYPDSPVSTSERLLPPF